MIAHCFATAVSLCMAQSVVSFPAPSEAATVCAADLQQRATAQLNSAQRAFENLDLLDAARRYAAAVQKLHRVAVLTGDVSQLATALSMLTATYTLLGDTNAACLTAQRVVALQPDFQPPRHIFNPSMLSQFHAATRSPTPQRRLTILPHPGNSQIYVDGRPVGTGVTNLSINANIPHYIYATSPGTVPQGAVMEADGLALSAEVHFMLVPPPAQTRPCS